MGEAGAQVSFSAEFLSNSKGFGYLLSDTMSAQSKGEKVYRGIAVSAGVCRGKILVMHRARHFISRREIVDAEIPAEIKRFEQSLNQTRKQISEVQRKVVQNMGVKEGDIFDAHLLMLEDRVLVDEVMKLIRDQKMNADYAFHAVSERYIDALAGWTTNTSANAPPTCMT